MFYRFYAKAHLAANQTLSWHEWSVGSQGFSQPLAPVLLLEDFFFSLRATPSRFPSLLIGSANFAVATTREAWQREKRKGRAITSVLISP